MIRASNNDCECRNDSLQTRGNTYSAARNRREQHDMRHVRNPVSEKRCDAPKRCPPADSDIDIGRQRHRHRSMRMNKGKQKSPRESRREVSNKQLFFFTANGGLFERPKAAFFYRRGGCRHVAHDGGDGGDDTEENSFSDGRHRHPHQGEADSRHHGFLYLCQPIIEISINGLPPPQLALRKQQQH